VRVARAAPLLLLAASCAHAVQSSAYATGRTGAPSLDPVEIGATRAPSDAEELGLVEAHASPSAGTLQALVAEFRERVASLGGDYGRIDSMATRYELVAERYDYECGGTETVMETQTTSRTGADGVPVLETESVPVTRYVSRTCTGERMVEAATLTLVGRAFRRAGGTR
jgi:hypothetical protein